MNKPFLPITSSRLKKTALIAAITGIIAGAFASSPTQILTALSSQQGLTIYKNLAYGTDPRQSLDLYQPDDHLLKTQHPKGLPVVIFIYGGSWQSGDKEGYGFAGRSLAQAGYLTAVIDYRLVPKNIYPDFVEDSVSAIAWVYQHAGQYGGDPNMIFVLGHSAGAFNAVAAVDDARFWSKSNVPDGAIKGVIGLAGPYSYDFRQFDSRVAFPNNMLPEQIMPDSHVRRNAPPHYLLVAEKDTLVGIKNLMKMKRGLERADVPVRTAVIPKVNHYTMIVALATPGRWLGETRQMVLDYLAERVHAESAS